MTITVITLTLLLIILVMVLVVPITVELRASYKYPGKDEDLGISYSTFKGLLSGETNISLSEMQDSLLKPLLKTFRRSDVTAPNRINADYLLRKTKVKGVKWHTVLGTGDAAQTGLLTGLIWSLKGALLGLLNHETNSVGRTSISVVPNYDQPQFTSVLDCILALQVGHIIIAWFKRGEE